MLKIHYKKFPLTWENTPKQIKHLFNIDVDKNGLIEIRAGYNGDDTEEPKKDDKYPYILDIYCPSQKDIRTQEGTKFGALNRYDTYPVYKDDLIFSSC